jgi:hypothetical protein
MEKNNQKPSFSKGDYNEDYDPEKDYGDYYDYDYDKSKDDYGQDENVTNGENVQGRVEPDLELIEAGPEGNDMVRFEESLSSEVLMNFEFFYF